VPDALLANRRRCGQTMLGLSIPSRFRGKSPASRLHDKLARDAILSRPVCIDQCKNSVRMAYFFANAIP
jgi:hypothetical protein